jgi:hydrogenase nickel incorporation protein HypA/HybF
VHELSIALSVLDIVRGACEERGLAGVRAVRIRVGAATGLEPDSLRFAFDCSKAGTPAAEAALEIEAVPIGGHCDGCGAEFDTPERYVLSCPNCGGPRFRITRGDELQVIDLEVDA